jgi:hypothetical protein
MQALTSGVSEWKEQQQASMAHQIEQAREDAAAELQKARDDVDVDAALKAQQKLDGLKPVQEVYKPNPILTDFYAKNPILDEASPQFDKEVWEDTRLMQNALLDKLTGGNREVQLTPSQVERSLKVAFTDAKALSPDKFSTATRRQPTPSADYVTRLKSVKSNSKNSRDTAAATEIYEMLKAKDPKAAETFAKNVLGE